MRIVINGKVILLILERKNKRVTWLARQVGIHPKNISRYIRGKRPVTPEVRERFMTVFRGRRWDDLFKIQDGTATAAHSSGSRELP